MTTWKIEGCTVDDAAALASNNVAAFWEDPSWIILWPKDIKQDYLIEQSSKRQAHNLLNQREVTRHQKAVDPVTGKVVGYARWTLPDGHSIGEDGRPVWTEAQVPDVSKEEARRFNELAKSAWWEFRQDMNAIDDKNHVVMDRILAERPYIQLDYLAVHPDNKGKGIATALVASGVDFANRIKLPLFVMAYKAGRGIYARLGFEEVDRVVQDDSQYGGAGEYAAYFMIYHVK